MRYLVVGGLALALGACASMDHLAFDSTPPGAAVATSSGRGCAATPCVIDIPRKESFVATFAKPGYRPAEVPVTAAVGDRGNGMMALTVLTGGIGGAIGYQQSGAGYDHTPNPVVGRLEPVQPAHRGRRSRKPATATAAPES